MDIIGRRRYDVALLADPSGTRITARLVGALGRPAEAGECRAVCLYRPENDVGECLQTNHGCGHNISKLLNPHNGQGKFIAEVIGWGKFIEGEIGWRTEWMEISGILCPSDTPYKVMEALSDYYNCPVHGNI